MRIRLMEDVQKQHCPAFIFNEAEADQAWAGLAKKRSWPKRKGGCPKAKKIMAFWDSLLNM